MYTQEAYKNFSRAEMEKRIRAEGFDPLLIHDQPGYFYSPHEHPETKLLAFVDGSMEVWVKSQHFLCKSGDKLIIPGNTKHSAKVGADGCLFYWSEKI